jgi:hypothetical protein
MRFRVSKRPVSGRRGEEGKRLVSQPRAASWLAEHGQQQLELLLRAIVFYPSAPILLADNDRRYHEASELLASPAKKSSAAVWTTSGTGDGFTYGGGTFTGINISDSGNFTQLYGVNDSGLISGYTESGSGNSRVIDGFLYNGSTFAPITRSVQMSPDSLWDYGAEGVACGNSVLCKRDEPQMPAGFGFGQACSRLGFWLPSRW